MTGHEERASGAPANLIGSWLHSFEEDTEATTVFRPHHHAFRPSRRVRRGVEFRADGTFVELRPGPDDRPRAMSGRWRPQEGGRVQITFHEGHGAPFELTIISCADDVLIISKRPGEGGGQETGHRDPAR
jgi:hypothetical protein